MRKASIISVVNQKGGVGKTTSVVNLGAAFARGGRKVLLIDMCQQGDLTSIYFAGRSWGDFENTLLDILKGGRPEDAIYPTRVKDVDLVPYHKSLELFFEDLPKTEGKSYAGLLDQAIRSSSIRVKYDIVLIDNIPANTGLLLFNSIAASDYYLVPIEATNAWSLDRFQMLDTEISSLRDRSLLKSRLLGVFLTRYDERKELCSIIKTEAREKFGDKLLSSVIHTSSKFEHMPVFGKTIFELGNLPAAREYEALCDEINNLIEAG